MDPTTTSSNPSAGEVGGSRITEEDPAVQTIAEPDVEEETSRESEPVSEPTEEATGESEPVSEPTEEDTTDPDSEGIQLPDGSVKCPDGYTSDFGGLNGLCTKCDPTCKTCQDDG